MLPCLQNPTTHYYASDAGLISGNPVTWIDKGNIKSIYDPCPYGYRVPINRTWAEFPSTTWAEGDIKGGAAWQSTWWPASGYRISSSAAMNHVATLGRYWSSSPDGSYTGYFLHFYCSGVVAPSNSNSRGYGFSLRCVQE